MRLFLPFKAHKPGSNTAWLVLEPLPIAAQLLMAAMATLHTTLHTLDMLPECRWIFQFWMLWKRSVLHQLRNPAEAAARILTAGWSGIIPGKIPTPGQLKSDPAIPLEKHIKE